MSCSDNPVGLLPIREAAKRIGRSREFVRQMGAAGAITLYRTGGSPEHPWLAVDPDELVSAYRRFIALPPAVTAPANPAPAALSSTPSSPSSYLRTNRLHPSVKGMRTPDARHGPSTP